MGKTWEHVLLGIVARVCKCPMVGRSMIGELAIVLHWRKVIVLDSEPCLLLAVTCMVT